MQLIKSLQNPVLFDHPVIKFEVIETHISWVLLTGQYAYKIKKPVNFGFLDFSTLEKRQFYCNEELRLNRRLAPKLYLEVITISGSELNPEINSSGPVIEYAVKMLQFPQDTQLDRLLINHRLNKEIMVLLANKIANFHLTINTIDTNSDFGNFEHVRQPVLDNFLHIRTNIKNKDILSRLTLIENWSKQQFERWSDLINQRKEGGFVRECHGDMHLRNIAFWDNEIIIFDCIEFNKNFYWIDVISEIAFLIMDLDDRNQERLALRFLNHYLEITGDYGGLKLLRFYKVYRALVRAKVNALRIGQENIESPEYKETTNEFLQYIDLANQYIQPNNPCLLINHGLSGSGKSFCTSLILDKYPAIKIRSDVERKRLFKMTQADDSSTSVGHGIYTKKATEKVYAHMVDLAEGLLTEGYSVVIDAANLKSEQRQLFAELGKSLNIPFVILNYHADVNILKERVYQRSKHQKDASDATIDVLEHQINNYIPLSTEEKTITVDIDTGKELATDTVINNIHDLTSCSRL